MWFNSRKNRIVSKKGVYSGHLRNAKSCYY